MIELIGNPKTKHLTNFSYSLSKKKIMMLFEDSTLSDTKQSAKSFLEVCVDRIKPLVNRLIPVYIIMRCFVFLLIPKSNHSPDLQKHGHSLIEHCGILVGHHQSLYFVFFYFLFLVGLLFYFFKIFF